MKLLTLAIFFCISSFAMAQTPSNNGSYGNTQTPNTTSSNNNGSYSTSSTRVVIPSGTELHVRVNENLSSENAQSGDRFTGTLADSVQVDGRTVLPRGADVAGRVISATPSGRLSNSGALELTVNTVRFAGQAVNLTSAPLDMKGESHTKSNATKVGGGAVLGAIIGGIAGGGKGAAIGATAGAGAGAAGAAATGRKPATVEPEAVLNFSTATDTTVYISPAMQSQIDSAAQSNSSNGSYSDSSSYPKSSSSSTGAYNDQRDSSNSTDDQPVLRRHDTPTGSSTPNSTTGAGSVYNGSVDNGANGQYGSNSQSANTTPANAQGFSLRDRRVIRSCVAANSTSLPSAATNRATTTFAVTPGSILPVDVQRNASPLPFTCERQLAPEANNTERVVYGRQVLLIDNNARVLDSFSLDGQ